MINKLFNTPFFLFFSAVIIGLMVLQGCERPENSSPDARAEEAPETHIQEIRQLENDLGRLLSQNPDHPEYKPKTRYLIEEYRRFAERFPQHEEAPEMLFRAANMQADVFERYGIAIGLFKQVADQWPESEQAPRAQFLAGYSYHHQLDETKEARKAYQTFLTRYPEHELRQAVEDELKFMDTGLQIDDLLQDS